MYLIIDEADGFIEESNGNKHLTFASADENKSSVEKINNKSGKYEKHFIKIKFNSDYNLPLDKILKLHVNSNY